MSSPTPLTANHAPRSAQKPKRGRPRSRENVALDDGRISAARRAVRATYWRLGTYEAVAAHYGGYDKATFYRLINDTTYRPSAKLIALIEAVGSSPEPALKRPRPGKRARRVTVALPADVAAQLDAARLPGENRVDAVRRLTMK